jgi:cathepsin B
MLANRFNIQSIGQMHIVLSPTKLILCDWQGKEVDIKFPENLSYLTAEANHQSFQNSACFGNSLVDACRYLYEIGTCTEDCIPYNGDLGIQSEYQKIGTFTNPAQLPLCISVAGVFGDMCSDFYIDKSTGVEAGTPERFYKALHFYGLRGTAQDEGSEFNIRDNIYKWGPVATGMKVYPNFYTFDAKNDIYVWDGEGPQVGGHAIELLGWGNENGIDYWIAKNSWGSGWGMNGYFRIKRGVDMCEIEDNCMGVVPDFFYPANHVLIQHEMLGEQQNIRDARINIATSLDIKAGGIDPETGFTRRVMVNMPWLILTPPVDWKELPDWKTFIAGQSASIGERNYSLKSDRSWFVWIYIGIGILILGILLWLR